MAPSKRTLEPRTLGGRVKVEREKLGSQSEVADRCGVSQATISSIEAGMVKVEKIRAQTLFALADLFQVRARWLLYCEPPRELDLARRLSPEERRLLAAYKDLPQSLRVTNLANMEALANVYIAQAGTVQVTPTSASKARPTTRKVGARS